MLAITSAFQPARDGRRRGSHASFLLRAQPRNFPCHFCWHPHCPHGTWHIQLKGSSGSVVFSQADMCPPMTITIEAGKNAYWGQLVISALAYIMSIVATSPALSVHLFALPWPSSHTSLVAHSLLSPQGHCTCAVLLLKCSSLGVYMAGSFSSLGS